jgi:hypothetical protein
MPVCCVCVVCNAKKVVQDVLSDAILTAYLGHIAWRMALRLSGRNGDDVILVDAKALL